MHAHVTRVYSSGSMCVITLPQPVTINVMDSTESTIRHGCQVVTRRAVSVLQFRNSRNAAGQEHGRKEPPLQTNEYLSGSVAQAAETNHSSD